jgi:ribosomal protein L21E
MKTLKLIMVSALCIQLSTAYAQEPKEIDTTSNPVRQGDPAVTQTPEQTQDNNLRDMVKITEAEIPGSLQNALKGSDYKGKSKTFYRSKSGDSYLVEIRDGNITQMYRFDKQGKPISSNKN